MVRADFGECIWCHHDRVLNTFRGEKELCRNCITMAYAKAKERGIPVDIFVTRIRLGHEGVRRTLTSRSLVNNMAKEVMNTNRKLLGVLREIANGDEYHYGYSRAKYLALQALKEINDDASKNSESARLPTESGVHEERGAG